MNYDYDELRAAQRTVERYMEDTEEASLEFELALVLLVGYVKASLDLSDEVDGAR